MSAPKDEKSAPCPRNSRAVSLSCPSHALSPLRHVNRYHPPPHTGILDYSIRSWCLRIRFHDTSTLRSNARVFFARRVVGVFDRSGKCHLVEVFWAIVLYLKQ